MKTTLISTVTIAFLCLGSAKAQDMANSGSYIHGSQIDHNYENPSKHNASPVFESDNTDFSFFSTKMFKADATNSANFSEVMIAEIEDGLFRIVLKDREENTVTSLNMIEPLFLRKKNSDRNVTIVRRDLLTDVLLVYTESERSTTSVINTTTGVITEHSSSTGVTTLPDLDEGQYILYTRPSTGEPAIQLINIW